MDGDDARGPIPLPTLLRLAGQVYRSAIQASLTAAGFDDLPRGGVFVIGAINRSDAPLSEIIRWLSMSKQGAGQMVDTLVLRGYLQRAVDAEDRRRLKVSLTERGQAVAAITRATIERLDHSLQERVGSAQMEQMRATLIALLEMTSKPEST